MALFPKCQLYFSDDSSHLTFSVYNCDGSEDYRRFTIPFVWSAEPYSVCLFRHRISENRRLSPLDDLSLPGLCRTGGAAARLLPAPVF